MKKQLSVLIFLLVSMAGTLSAQVKELEKNMVLGLQNALVLDIPQADDKLVARVWNNYVKDYYKGKNKQVKGGGEIISSELSVPSLNPGGTVDLYALPEKAGNDVRFVLWIKMPQGFLSSHAYPDQYRDAEALLKRFGVEVNKEKIRMELAEQEKELANLEKEMKHLQADNAKFRKEIEDAKARIQKAEENIVQNEKDQKLSEDKIANQKKSVDAVRKRLEQQR